MTALARFSELLLEWNKKINLISRKDEENFWTSHLLHCLALLFKIDLPSGSKILDLGTGGGLPGIPVKIARPDISMTLLDSTQKKINVVKEIIGTLGLVGIDAVWGRAEELGKAKAHHRQYDVVVARAVASLKDLVRWAEPFLISPATKPVAVRGSTPSSRMQGPSLVTLKGGDLEGEIAQVRNLRQINTITVLDLTLRGSNQLEGGEKKVVIVEFGRNPKQKTERP